MPPINNHALVLATHQGVLDPIAAATQLKQQAYQAALCALNLSEATGDITDEQHARVSEMTLRFLVDVGSTADNATLSYADEARKEEVWLFLGMGSWAEFVAAALPESGDKKWRSILNNYWRVCDKLPGPIVTQDGREINREWLLNHPSIVQDLIPATANLNVEEEEGRARFDEIVKIAATQPRSELRDYLTSQGLRGSALPEITCPMSVVKVVDQETGEVVEERYCFDIQLDDASLVAWLKRRLAPVITFKETSA